MFMISIYLHNDQWYNITEKYQKVDMFYKQEIKQNQKVECAL